MLKYHTVQIPFSKGDLLKATLEGDPVKYWPHWTAVIEEKKTGQRYAVDPWIYANGENPRGGEGGRLVHQGPRKPSEIDLLTPVAPSAPPTLGIQAFLPPLKAPKRYEFFLRCENPRHGLVGFGQNCEMHVQMVPVFDYDLGGSRIGMA
ncbi:MAG: hypothetical protein WB662_11510 [Methyloceanibacter sp.]